MMDRYKEGLAMYKLAGRLFPICRSITGNGFRKSLNIIKDVIPEIQSYEVLSGTHVFDWNVPDEWNINDAYIETLSGDKIIDFNVCNLHVLGYSIPVNKIVSKNELLEHVYTIPEQPEWIPYVTSYYKERWGFCMSDNQKSSLSEDKYHVVIDSSLKNGSLTYGELVIPGILEKEILFTTYLCHPSMANNELSGPVLLTELIKYVRSLKNRRYTYRFVINPETIGSITYLSKNFEILKHNVVAGFVLSCVGDNRSYSIVSTKYENTLADKVLNNVLKFHAADYKKYSYLKRGSDERQFGAPGIDLPVCGFCRTKYGEYPEYHTSADDMSIISPEGLQGAYDVMVKVIDTLEYNHHYQVTCLCEPQLGKRGLYPTISKKGQYNEIITLTNLITYCDGTNDLIDISNIIGVPTDLLISHIEKLVEEGLLEK